MGHAFHLTLLSHGIKRLGTSIESNIILSLVLDGGIVH